MIQKNFNNTRIVKETEYGIIDREWYSKCELPLVFLDIDGVLNDGDWAKTIIDGKVDISCGVIPHIFCDPYAVERIKDFCDKEGAFIVLTSSWRERNMCDTITHMEKFGNFKLITPYIIGQTARLRHKVSNDGKEMTRGDEINIFVTHYEVSRYVIIDDDTDFTPLQKKEHFVHINSEHGLTSDDIDKMRSLIRRHFS